MLSDLPKITRSNLNLILLIPSPVSCLYLRGKNVCRGRVMPSSESQADGLEEFSFSPSEGKCPLLVISTFGEGLVLSGLL